MKIHTPVNWHNWTKYFFISDLYNPSTRLDLTGSLKAFLEKLKETLKNGDESKGIPPLDPLASPEIGPLTVDWEDLV